MRMIIFRNEDKNGRGPGQGHRAKKRTKKQERRERLALALENRFGNKSVVRDAPSPQP